MSTKEAGKVIDLPPEEGNLGEGDSDSTEEGEDHEEEGIEESCEEEKGRGGSASSSVIRKRTERKGLTRNHLKEGKAM